MMVSSQQLRLWAYELPSLPAVFWWSTLWQWRPTYSEMASALRRKMAGCGPVLIDLAALTAGGWTEADRHAIALAYHEESGAGNASSFFEAPACCRVMLALQWLGWAKEWIPPAEHRRDWLEQIRGWLDECA